MQKDITNFLTVLLVLENNNKVFGPIAISYAVGFFLPIFTCYPTVIRLQEITISKPAFHAEQSVVYAAL